MTRRNAELLPLSVGQQGVWFAQQLDPRSPVYTAGDYVDIRGPIDVVAFREAARRVVAAAETLRVRVVEQDGEPWQAVGAVDASVPVVDLTGEQDPAAAAERWLREETLRPFDLGRPPLFRFTLLKTAEDRWLWCHVYHHLILDAYGVSLIASRMAAEYTAVVSGVPAAEAPAGNLRGLLDADAAYRASPVRERDSAFWSEYLAPGPAPTVLSSRPAGVSDTFLRQGHDLPGGVDEGLRAAAARLHTSPARLVTAALALHAHRWTGQRDVTLSVPVHGRTGSVLRSTPGMVTNMLPVRLSVRPRLTVPDLVGTAARELTEVLRHHRYRGEDIRRDLGLSTTDRRFFGPVVNVQQFDHELRFGAAAATAHNLSNGPVEDLAVNVHAWPGGIRLELHANPAGYTPGDLSAHAAHLRAILDDLAGAHDDTPAGGLGLRADDHRRLVEEPNRTDADVPAATVAEQIAAQAARTPDAPAVTSGGTTLTYRELDRAANGLAHELTARRIGPGAIVALLLPRTPDLLVAMLAVMRTRAAFLPLDPGFPADRVARTLAEADPALMVTTAALGAEAPGTFPQYVIDDGRTRTGRETPPAGTAHPELPAYVLSTSGSTGVPKGVVVTEGNLRNLLTAMGRLFPLTAADRLLAVTTVGFDIAMLELLLPLVCGAEVVLAPADDVREPAALLRLLGRHRVTAVQATPTLWRELVAADAEALAGLRVLVGGEALDAELAEALTASAREVWNVYGPTETTIWSTTARLSSAEPEPLIGRPLANSTAYVLDDGLQPVPDGAIGELYLGGKGVAAGYLRRPDLTAERFVAARFGPGGSRWYRTGDLVRRRRDGRLEFLGRADDQVKVRGFRVEPGDVEAALVTHPDVHAAAVTVPAGGTGLVAYVVPATDATVDPVTVRRHVAALLPAYMVPTVVSVLPELPTTPNGKVDRSALPAAAQTVGMRGRGPRTPQEQVLCGLYAEVLALPAVGIDDNFFELGGHSLLATRLIDRIKQTLGNQLGFRGLLEAPTVAELARRLGVDTSEEPFEVIMPLRSSGTGPALFCVHPMGGPSWVYSPLLMHVGPDFPVYGLQPRNLARPEPMPESIAAMAADYVAQMRGVQPKGPYHVLGHSFGGIVAHEMAVQLREAGEEVALLGVLADYPSRSDIENHRIPSDQEFFTAAVASTGYDMSTLPEGPLEPTFVAKVLREGNSPFALFGEYNLVALIEIYRNSVRIMAEHRPRRFDGTTYYFRPTLDKEGRPKEQENVWLTLVDGPVSVHDVECAHETMILPMHLAVVGGVLGSTMDRLYPRDSGSRG